MDKKERYINFIVADLVKKTEIDYEQGKIKFPYLSHSLLLFYPLNSLYFLKSPFFYFSNYLLGRYAINEGLSELWGLYINKIKNKVDTYSK